MLLSSTRQLYVLDLKSTHFEVITNFCCVFSIFLSFKHCKNHNKKLLFSWGALKDCQDHQQVPDFWGVKPIKWIYNFHPRRAVGGTVNIPSGVCIKVPRVFHFRPLQHPRWLKIKLLTKLIHSCKRIHRIAKEAPEKWLKVLSKGVGAHAPAVLLVPMILTVDEFVFAKILHTNIMIMLTTS